MPSVTARALVKRINRRLSTEGERLRTLRGARWSADLGDHYIVTDGNLVVAKHVDVTELARQLGVISPTETVRP